MSRSTIAMLLSAFVLPGAGQIYLKRAWRGSVLIVVSLVCVWIIGDSMWQQASAVLAQLQSGEVPIDPDHISALVAQTPASAGTSAATWVLLGCWLGGLIDIYWLGKKTP